MLVDTERRPAHGFWAAKTQHQVELARFECSKPMREPALAISEPNPRTNRSGENPIQTRYQHFMLADTERRFAQGF